MQRPTELPPAPESSRIDQPRILPLEDQRRARDRKLVGNASQRVLLVPGPEAERFGQGHAGQPDAEVLGQPRVRSTTHPLNRAAAIYHDHFVVGRSPERGMSGLV